MAACAHQRLCYDVSVLRSHFVVQVSQARYGLGFASYSVLGTVGIHTSAEYALLRLSAFEATVSRSNVSVVSPKFDRDEKRRVAEDLSDRRSP